MALICVSVKIGSLLGQVQVINIWNGNISAVILSDEFKQHVNAQTLKMLKIKSYNTFLK